MRVLVLGGTGSIGGPVVRELIRAGHEVVALTRSVASAASVPRIGARPIAGDMATPERWLADLPPLDGVIHAAAAFGADDETTERRLLQTLLPHLRAAARNIRFIYTGGCWLYGMSDEARETTEATPFDPLPAFAWGVAHCRLVLEARGIDPIVIHPAMVYEPCGGVFARFRTDATGRDAVRVVAGEQVHWPLGPRRGPRHPVSVGAGRKRSPGKLHRRRNRRHAGGPHRPGICATVRHALSGPRSHFRGPDRRGAG